MDVVIGAEDTERHKPDPDPVLEALRRLGAEPGGRGLRRGLAVRHPRGERCRRAHRRGRLGRHPPGRAPAPRGAGCARAHGGGAPWRPLIRRSASPSCAGSSSTTTTATTSSTTRRSPTRAYDALYDELKRSRQAHPELVTPDSPTQRVGGARRGRLHEGRPPPADGLAREGDDRRGAREVGRRRPQAARDGRAGRVRHRAEDRRVGDLARLRERRLRARGDARRRHRGARTSPATSGPSTPSRSGSASATASAPPPLARGARRDLLPALGVRALQRARRSPPARSRRRTLGTRPRAPSGSSIPAITAERPLSLWVYGVGCARGRPARRRSGSSSAGSASTGSGRTRTRSDSSRSRRWPSVPRLGAAPVGARLRDRRDRDQGRRPRPAAPARRAARSAALGARVQVGADRGGDDAAQDPHPGRDGRARSTRGRSSSPCTSAASRSPTRRSTTRRTSTARTSARATSSSSSARAT